ncbi:MAG TPA: beta-L-arabinofuranosidase domain-containing protein [bacterium]|nr:beta-L-arabinofuranosidase domain-containing protein [bacterium]
MKLPFNKFILALVGVVALTISAGADVPALKVPRPAEPFPLTDVRLLDGPFRDAMLRDQKYLLSLEPDRLLHTFRLNVKLSSSAQPLGGWEDPTCDLRGHSLGHYLSALSLMYASTGDARFKQRVDYIVGALAQCQSNSVSAGFNPGYLSAFPESLIDRVEKSQPVWAPWYTLHKIMAGLLDAYQYCGNQQALAVLEKMANWVKFRVDRLSPEQMQKSLNTEHGGMNEVLANLYGVTGNPNYLQLSAAFNHARVLDPLAHGEDRLNGLHANTQIPKVIGVTREYEFTGDTNFLAMAETFWDSVALRRSYVIGGDSDHEHFFPTNDFAQHLSTDTAETCNTYNMLKLTREMFSLQPDAAKMDFYERGLYNHILASQEPETGMFVYLMSLKPGHFKTYSTPENSFWCCVGTGMENHSKYGDSIYFHDADSLYVNLFIASELNWREKQLSIRQETKFPESDTSVLKIKTAKPQKITLKIRQPAWAAHGVKISVNGVTAKIEATSAPESYAAISRVWRDGDEVEIQMPMKLHTEFLPGTTNEIAVLYGPIVLAGELGTNAMPYPFARTQTEFSKLPVPSAPMFATSAADLLKHIKPVAGSPLTFRTDGIGRPRDVTLIPFYELHRQRYSVYWQLISDAEWKLKSARIAAEEAHRMAEEARVVDVVRPGETQSETDHKWQGEDTQAGDSYGFKWRRARGWFSYEVKVVPGIPQLVAVALRDGSVEDFELSVDGKALALQPEGDGAEKEFLLPAELTRGRQSVVLKFSARPPKSVPTITGVRVLKFPAETSSASNLAPAATASTSHVSGDTSLEALNDGYTPRSSRDDRRGSYGNWPNTGTQWVEYDWSQPISTKQIEVYWWDDNRGVRLPKACRVKFWNGRDFVAVTNAAGLGVAADKFNVTTFPEVTTTKLRLEMDGNEQFSTGVLEWRVLDSGKSPEFPPKVWAGVDRDVMLNGKTYLSGIVKFLKPNSAPKILWSKSSGPGEVSFADAQTGVTTATFSKPGAYVLKLAAGEGKLVSSSTLNVKVATPPPADRLDVVYTKRYQIDNPLWNAKAKALIVTWIPHCIDEINRTNIPANQGDGGIDNFIEAAKALRGEPHGPHKGYVFANAWVHQTVESMCIALMVDPQGDKEIIAAQEKMKATLEDWIPKILAAQEPDGYLQTAYTLADRRQWPSRWNPAQRGNHEGYVMGYFIESAINHYTLTGGTDKRLYNAAKKLCDCWVANIGPGKKEWYDGHEQMEQGLVRFGRFVNDVEGGGKGDSYIALAKFLLDCRGRHGGSEYDQTQSPVQQQYEAVGHAVRASYLFSAMSDVAAETHDTDYQSAVLSLWDNLINKKYYVTGGIGSGETSEGFGGNYSLPNSAYCESCSSCGLIFFQWKMNLAYHDAKYADLYEETMYNALLGSTDVQGAHFYYDNPLVEDKARYAWHVCPCCVGNIPRTLLMIPTWTYVKSDEGIYVNLFIGSTINVERVAGTDVQMVQKTDYPWNGKVSITVNPKQTKKFSVFVRVPDRTTSELYTPTPQVSGIKSLVVNGDKISPKIENGYAVITREWKAGDKIDFELPMGIQVVRADERIKADRGLVALRYGPLLYTIETADQPKLDLSPDLKSLTPAWRGDLLGGVMVIQGKWSNVSPLLAIPNYARQNRGGQSAVWLKE